MNRKRKKDECQKNDMKEFLKLYRSHSCLWDFTNSGYAKQSTRLQALEDIAQHFNMTVEQVKRKIHTTRSTYNQMRLKTLDTENTASPYKPILSW